MASAGRITGKDIYVTFGGTVISGDFTSVNRSDEADLADATAGADTRHYYIATGREDGNVGFECMYDGSTVTVWTAIAPNAQGTLIIAPKGTTAGYPKWTTNKAIVASREIDFPFDDAVTVTAEFQVCLAWSETTW